MFQLDIRYLVSRIWDRAVFIVARRAKFIILARRNESRFTKAAAASSKKRSPPKAAQKIYATFASEKWITGIDLHIRALPFWTTLSLL